MSSTRVIYFMYHHFQHCSLTKSPPKPPKSMESFTLFPLLPAELRLKIWQTIASEPQTVELSCTNTSSFLPEGRWFSHNKPPIIFTICSESRDVAMSMYSVLTYSPGQLGAPWPKIYINFSVDTIWLCADLNVEWARDLLERNEQLKDRLKYLAVGERMWKDLNQTLFTPGWSGIGPGNDGKEFPVAVIANLIAIENVRFHS